MYDGGFNRNTPGILVATARALSEAMRAASLALLSQSWVSHGTPVSRL